MSKNRPFEEALEALEERVRRLESGELSLDDALKLFEEGVELTRESHEKLDAADQKITELSRNMDGSILEESQ